METSAQFHVGVIGCGKISSIYFESLSSYPILKVTACADIDMASAQRQAERYSIPHVYTVDELLADPTIDIVLNLTIPQAHTEVGQAALRANKAVYSEKPLGINRAQGQALLAEAERVNKRVGSAPDTFLGGGIQTCINLINAGAIGVPVAATAFMMSHGPEGWHPNPDFYYQVGGGPLFDMGPYYLTALIAMLGPVRRVTGSARITTAQRMITSEPRAGTMIQVNTPTHIASVLDFDSGPIATLVTSFDVWSHQLPRIEVYGTEGTLSVPDPNTFGGPVSMCHANDSEWHDVPLTHQYTENSRGIGLVDMAYAIQTNRAHRASGAMAYHVLDIMDSILQASHEGHHIELTSRCEKPAPLPPGQPLS